MWCFNLMILLIRRKKNILKIAFWPFVGSFSVTWQLHTLKSQTSAFHNFPYINHHVICIIMWNSLYVWRPYFTPIKCSMFSTIWTILTLVYNILTGLECLVHKISPVILFTALLNSHRSWFLGPLEWVKISPDLNT